MSTAATPTAPHPDKTAVVIAESGESLTHRALQERTHRLAAHLIRWLEEGEVIAVLLSNRLEYFEVCLAARRAGLYYAPVSTHLNAAELAYILQDSGARVLVTELRHAPLLDALDASVLDGLRLLWVDGAGSAAGEDYAALVGQGPLPPLVQRRFGLDFAYSSGTTGRPKGIRHDMRSDAVAAAVRSAGWTSFFQLDANSVYLSPAPLYHAAPLRFSLRCLGLGGTVVTMRKFDAEGALRAIDMHRVTHSQWVPTMFVRLLALPKALQRRHDLSSHRMALHAAAPCPIEVKRRMLDWWGPIVWEYYTGSERAGATVISPQEWLAHPGSVGRAVQGTLHIVDEQGQACPPGVDGLVCFEGGPRFEYHGDPDKTREAYTAQGWASFGDIGHVDGGGYLYLTDRRANMIISGGVNIYPQEAENTLLAHPLVHDVAVIGVPNADFGEEVKAVVELRQPELASQATADLLIAHCREHLSHLKCPRTVDFASALPRSETGKLLKRLIRDQYRAAHQARAAAPTAAAPPTSV